MKAVILAGGKGTRLSHLTATIPKPMIPVGGKPLIERHVEQLADFGIKDIYITVSYLSELIKIHLGTGERWNVNIVYYDEAEPLGTVGGVKALESHLNEDFLVIYGDVLWKMDLHRLSAFHTSHNGIATLVVHPNDHPHDSDLLELDRNKRITRFFPKPHPEGQWYPNMVNAGIYLFSPALLPYIPAGKADFGKDIFPLLVHEHAIYGYNTTEYLKDMGTPDRLAKVEQHLADGFLEKRSLENPQKAIFLDRDGVLNEERNFIHREEDLVLFPYTAEAIRQINRSGYLSVLTTNQSVIARNMITEEGLRNLHHKMETQLGEHGAWLDEIKYCPHHPDKGYPEENPDYKMDCECRKPKPGMLLEAARDFHISLPDSWMIGDSEVDVKAGRAAGVTTVGVATGKGMRKTSVLPDFMFENLAEAVDFIITDPYKPLAEQLAQSIRENTQSPYIIAIGGNTRSGKSTLAKSLALHFRKNDLAVLEIALDDWILPADQRPPGHRFMENFQYKKIETDLPRILSGEAVTLEGYSRHPERQAIPVTYQYSGENVVIIEGVIALELPAITDIAQQKMFKSIPFEQLEQSMKNYYRWKGKSDPEIDTLWQERLEQEYRFIDTESRGKADTVV